MAQSKEASARIKINKLLEESGWRFEDSVEGRANILVESGVKFNSIDDNFENAITKDGRRGSIDFLLLDKDGRPLVVLEAKKASIDPLSAKDQARNYAYQSGARFVILSNGNIHYFWDTKHGNPDIITRFPTQDSITQHEKYQPNHLELSSTKVNENYIIQTQIPNFATDPDFENENTRPNYLKKYKLKQLRPYQVRAIQALQEHAKQGKSRFLFEMATGTGKTLISSAVIKLFLKSGNARRVLFLVDRLELEDQAQKAFQNYLGKDFTSIIYKENKESWKQASIVVSTIQTFLAGDRYKKDFSPTDFELVISDESHRSIGGNSRAVFEYFVGYKLGLTATPKNYLRGFNTDDPNSQREYEKRVLIDTYKTFGCEPGYPTFSYDLETGSNEGYLIKPTVVDARTNITTQLLSDEGYSIKTITSDGQDKELIFKEKDYEKRIFNEETNIAMCQALLDNGLYDPIAKQLGINLFGKTIVFAVSQKHAARLTNILNKLATQKWPDQYNQSDFAVQISSDVYDSQQMTINFTNNNLNGHTRHPEGYDSSKTRIAVTVGMMTTGYDCQDLLNIALMRPVYSPTDFVQIKGRGTRKYTFEYDDYTNEPIIIEKSKYKLFDFFATCEYFETKYDYDEKITLPSINNLKSFTTNTTGFGLDGNTVEDTATESYPVNLATTDELKSITETPEGVTMRIDREGFKRAVQEDILSNPTLTNLWHNGDIEEAENFAKKEIFDKPKYFLNLDKIRQIFNIDRRITLKEFLQVAFGEKQTFEMKDDLIEAEWNKFQEINFNNQEIDPIKYQAVKSYFKAYIIDPEVRDIVKKNQPAEFYYCASFDFQEYQRLNGYKEIVPQYINDYAYHLTNISI